MSEIHVFDTYAKSGAGRIMHFDVVLAENDPVKALESAKIWLKGIGEESATVSPAGCCYCHSEPTAPAELLAEIEARGFAIYKLEGCPK